MKSASSESEGSLYQGSDITHRGRVYISGLLGELTIEIAKIEDGWGYCDLIGYLVGIPPLPGVLPIMGWAVAAFTTAGHERGLAHRKTSVVAFSQHIAPLNARIPRLRLLDIDRKRDGRPRVGVDPPSGADRGQPAAPGGLPVGAEADGIHGAHLQNRQGRTGCHPHATAVGVGAGNPEPFRDIAQLHSGGLGGCTVPIPPLLALAPLPAT